MSRLFNPYLDTKQDFPGQFGAMAFLSTLSESELFSAVGAVVKMRAYRRIAPRTFVPGEPLVDRINTDDDAWNRKGEWAPRESTADKPVLNPPADRSRLSHESIVAYIAQYNNMTEADVEAALSARPREGTPPSIRADTSEL